MNPYGLDDPGAPNRSSSPAAGRMREERAVQSTAEQHQTAAIPQAKPEERAKASAPTETPPGQ